MYDHHYYFKEDFNYQQYVCNKCHVFSMTVIDLSNFFISNIKSKDYRVYISNIDKKEAIIIFKKSKLGFKTLSKPLVFIPNITPVDIIKNQRFNQRLKKGAFGGNIF